ncbi:MAG: bifunctional UDP-N-acetylglucosamine diphosphorylase/glucosamine-1-phosphate N-acetyltransferase GlmU [Candidatus Dormibacteria bacterium]
MADGPQAVILAAGQGTRMRSTRPKVLHPLAGRALILHVVATARAATGQEPIVVVNPAHSEMAEVLAGQATAVPQREARGTGDALRSVPERLRHDGPVVVLAGDVPLLGTQTLRSLLDIHESTGAPCALLTVVPEDPRGLGRIIRDSDGRVTAIVEERDLVPGLAPPTECNAGVYVFSGRLLWPALERLRPDNAQGEFYLTDVVAYLAGRVEGVLAADPREAMGINDRRQLAAAEAVLRARVLDALMEGGVTIEDPSTTYIDAQVHIGEDSVLRPMTSIRGPSSLGSGCVIGPMAQLRDVRAGDGVEIGSSVIEEAELGDGVTIGHFNRVRPNSTLRSGVSLGTHAEVKNSTIGADSRINHFSSVLDSDLGRGVNIGAGTVTCNYDGTAKHRITIDDAVFVGSNSTLVAPLHIARDAYIAAGSVVTGDVPQGGLAVGRARQRNVEGWRARRRAAAQREAPP